MATPTAMVERRQARCLVCIMSKMESYGIGRAVG